MSPSTVSALHTQLAVRVTELLADGEWHRYEQVIRALIKLVPPGTALRKNEARRLTQHGGRGPGERVQPQPTEALIASGARIIVKDFLRSRSFEQRDGPVRSGSPKAGETVHHMIRLVAMPTAAKGLIPNPTLTIREQLQQQRDDLELENETLRDQVTNLRVALIALGHEKRADELAPTLPGEVRNKRATK